VVQSGGAIVRPVRFGVTTAIESATLSQAPIASTKLNIDYAEWAAVFSIAKTFASSS
jgi:hypothetical protein